MKKWVIYLVFIVLLVSSVSAQYYYTGGRSLLGDFNLIEFYFNHPYEIDFFIFLIIFLGLTKSVFKKQFKKEGNLMTVGVSIALAFGLVFWEYNTGKFLLGYGSIGILFLVLIIFVALLWPFLKFLVRTIFPK